MINTEAVIAPVLELIKDTAAFIRHERSEWKYEDTRSKADSSLVTSIDVATEHRLAEGLGKIVPEADLLAEENHHSKPDKDLAWIVDPIDGTTNFVHGFPVYCISVALYEQNRPLIGVIYEITSNECFFATSGKEGAYLNNKPIRASKASVIRESVLATGFPPGGFNELDEYLARFKTFMLEAHGLRRLGSAAMDLAYVAAGRCDGFFEYNLNPWDVAAGAFIVEKAGGKVTDFSGKDNFLYGKEILASNSIIHDEFLSYFKKQ